MWENENVWRALVVSYYATQRNGSFLFNVFCVYRFTYPKGLDDSQEDLLRMGVSRIFGSAPDMSLEDALAKVLSCISGWLEDSSNMHKRKLTSVTKIVQHPYRQSSPFRRRHCFVRERKGDGELTQTVYKWYDCSFKDEAATHRRPDYYKEDFLNLNPRVYQLSRRMCLLEYAYLAGEPKLTKVHHAVSLLDKLRQLHDKGIVHGDVRLSNLVCGPTETWWIDLDYSGKEGESRYPSGWNHSLDDGLRHPDAVEFTNLEKVHDLFAFSDILSRFKCDEETLQEKWKNAVTWVDAGELSKARDIMMSFPEGCGLELNSEHPSYSTQNQNENEEPIFTGSPPGMC